MLRGIAGQRLVCIVFLEASQFEDFINLATSSPDGPQRIRPAFGAPDEPDWPQ
jgi:hypothetical protein